MFQNDEEVWSAVRTGMAAILSHDPCRDVLSEQRVIFEEKEIRARLVQAGYTPEAIAVAMEWLEQAWRSGGLVQALQMNQVATDAVRVPHVLEDSTLPERALRALRTLHSQGILSFSDVETSLEWLRLADVRGWEDEDVFRYLEGLFHGARLEGAARALSQLARGRAAQSTH